MHGQYPQKTEKEYEKIKRKEKEKFRKKRLMEPKLLNLQCKRPFLQLSDLIT